MMMMRDADSKIIIPFAFECLIVVVGRHCLG